jgi:hypothetical protein
MKYIIVNVSKYVLYNTSFGINISDNPVEQIIGISFIGASLLHALNTIILKNVIKETHIKNTKALFIVTVNIENSTILTQIIIGE